MLPQITNAPRSQGTFQLSPGHPNIPGYHAVANIKPVNASGDDFIVNPCNLARARCAMSGDAKTEYGPYWCCPRLLSGQQRSMYYVSWLLAGLSGRGTGAKGSTPVVTHDVFFYA